MFLRTLRIMKVAQLCVLGLVLLVGSSLVYAGTPNSNTVVNNGMSSWAINGQTNPSLTLVRGQTYEFVMQNTSGAHPFNINAFNTTGSANRYNNGVTNNGASGTQTLTFVVPIDAPDGLHYNCGNHAAMNGPISIINEVLFADGFDPIQAVAPK